MLAVCCDVTTWLYLMALFQCLVCLAVYRPFSLAPCTHRKSICLLLRKIQEELNTARHEGLRQIKHYYSTS